MIALLLLGCSDANYVMAGDAVSFDCGYTTTDVAWDDAELLGVSPAVLLAPHLGSFTSAGAWADGTPVAVSAEIVPSGALPQWAAAEGPAGEICGDRLLIPVSTHVATADGAFSEAFDVDWQLLPDDSDLGATLPFGGEREDESMDGSFRESDVAVAEDEEVQWLTVAASHGPDGLHGRVDATVWSDEDDRGQAVLAW